MKCGRARSYLNSKPFRLIVDATTKPVDFLVIARFVMFAKRKGVDNYIVAELFKFFLRVCRFMTMLTFISVSKILNRRCMLLRSWSSCCAFIPSQNPEIHRFLTRLVISFCCSILYCFMQRNNCDGAHVCRAGEVSVLTRLTRGVIPGRVKPKSSENWYSWVSVLRPAIKDSANTKSITSLVSCNANSMLQK